VQPPPGAPKLLIAGQLSRIAEEIAAALLANVSSLPISGVATSGIPPRLVAERRRIKAMAVLEQVEPPSWVIGNLVRQAGHAGILYRSTRDPQRLYLVRHSVLSHRFPAPVYVPEQLLPRNADSCWSSRQGPMHLFHVALLSRT
jgi:hypothetical protein